MSEPLWTIKFKGYLPIDHRMEDRLRRVMAEFDRVPDSAIDIDEAARVVTIDYGQVKDWAEDSRKLMRVLRAGKRIVMKPPWEEYEPEDGEVVISIEAGHIFGSGMHETTSLCLAALEDYVWPGCSVLDFGAGTGILAIAAAKLGAAKVAAIEANLEAVLAAEANMVVNSVSNAVKVVEGMSPLDGGIKADVLTANIIPKTIIANLEPLTRTMSEDAKLILSGLSKKTCVEVEESLPGAGLKLIEKRTEGEWVALVASPG